MLVGAITGPRPVINNFSFPKLAAAQRQHDVWSKVIYALESGDDLLICGKDIDSRLTNLETVLRTLQEAGLKANLSKCEFLMAQISFLGHKVDGDGIHTMDDKI